MGLGGPGRGPEPQPLGLEQPPAESIPSLPAMTSTEGPLAVAALDPEGDRRLLVPLGSHWHEEDASAQGRGGRFVQAPHPDCSLVLASWEMCRDSEHRQEPPVISPLAEAF